MALKFIGDATQEFQEQQIVPYTPVSGNEWLSAVGLNPTLESISVQAMVIALAVVTVVVLQWRSSRASPTSNRARVTR